MGFGLGEKDMKYIVVLGDGMSDEPVEALNGKTPLECANIPTMDELAAKGEMGMVQNVPAGMSPGSEVANLSVMGYDLWPRLSQIIAEKRRAARSAGTHSLQPKGTLSYG